MDKELSDRLTTLDEKLDHVLKQNQTIMDLMVKFIDHVEEIEAIAVKTNVMKN